jgi:hypothetical protein
MDENVFISMSIEQRREYCLMKISEHSPPRTPHDQFMIKVYKGLLDLHDDADPAKDLTEKESTYSMDNESR